MKYLFPILVVLTGILLSYALYQALEVAPTDQLQGDVYRIIYYHVPSAWTAFLLFFVNFGASVYYLIKRCEVADIVALTAAEVGVVFQTVNLVTGPIWARPVWGIWWTWDLRLTSTLVLWLIYVSYLFLRRFSSSGETPLLAAALAILGALCVPFRLFFHLVFPHPASAARNRWRRFHGPANVAHPAAELAGILLLRIPRLLVALSPREAAARGRQGPRHAIPDGRTARATRSAR